jgi:hypothetical protein
VIPIVCRSRPLSASTIVRAMDSPMPSDLAGAERVKDLRARRFRRSRRKHRG